jgi:hypothetical protein
MNVVGVTQNAWAGDPPRLGTPPNAQIQKIKKRQSSQHTQAWGVLRLCIFFPWENRADFEALQMEMIDPCGAFEEEAVFTIASCMCRPSAENRNR